MSLFGEAPEDGDMFGLEAEARIIESKIRTVFTPHTPIDSRAHFFGRQIEVQKLVAQMNTPGQHALLYGDRGIGKSSLAAVTGEVLLGPMSMGKLFVKRCGSSDNFETIIAPLLKFFGVLNLPDEISIQSSTGKEAVLKLPYVEGKASSGSQKIEKWKHENNFNPSEVAELFRRRHAILIVDEADSISNLSDRFKLAEMVKHLSDNKSNVKLLIVGIASTGMDLLAGHPSVDRCIKDIKLEKMPDDEIERIVRSGAKKCDLHFDQEVVSAIVSLSSGYPHFAHLLCLKSSEDAVGKGRNVITREVLVRAMSSSVGDVERALRDRFEVATRSNSTDMYKWLLLAAAQISSKEFSAEKWREAYQGVSGKLLKKQALNRYLDRLVTDETTSVLKKVARGTYSFVDPRMPCFVRIEAGQRGFVPTL